MSQRSFVCSRNGLIEVDDVVETMNLVVVENHRGTNSLGEVLSLQTNGGDVEKVATHKTITVMLQWGSGRWGRLV